MYLDTESDGISPSPSASLRLCFATLSSRRLGKLTTKLTGLRPSILDLICLSGCERTRGVTLFCPVVLLLSFNVPIVQTYQVFILYGLARHYGGLLTVIPKPLFTNICFASGSLALALKSLDLYFLRSGSHYSLHFGRSSHPLTVLLARDPFPNVVIVVIWLCFSLLSLWYCCILAFICVLSPFLFD